MKDGLLYLERLNFVLRGPAVWSVVILLLALIYAGWSGDRWRDAQQENVRSWEAAELAETAEYRAELVAIEAGEVEPTLYDANPMSVSFPAVLPPAALADFAVGHADLQPASALLSPWRNLLSTFGRYQFDNPTMLATPRLDVALVVVLLMPIMMIAVSFNVLAAERASGALPMILASPVSLSRVVWTRLAVRNGVIWATALAAMVVLAVLNDEGGNRLPRFGLWLFVSLAYGLFWFTLIAYCVARCRSATATAGAMFGAWLLFALALPAGLATLSESLYPTPSRLAFLTEVRQAQGETNRELARVTEGFLLDHPEMTVGADELPSYFRAAFLANEAARESTRPILEAYDAARAGRERTLEWAQYLSPAIITQRLLARSAGADLERQFRFQAQVRAALAELSDVVGPAVVSRNRTTLADFDRLRPFEFRDMSSRGLYRTAVMPLIFLLTLGLVIGLAAQLRLARTNLGSE